MIQDASVVMTIVVQYLSSNHDVSARRHVGARIDAAYTRSHMQTRIEILSHEWLLFMQSTNMSSLLRANVVSTVACTLLALAAATAGAGPREQAKRIHDRLAGVPPSASVLDAMEADISG